MQVVEETHAQAVAPRHRDGTHRRRAAVAANGTGDHVRTLTRPSGHAHRGEPCRESRLLAPPCLRPWRLRLAACLQVVMGSRKASWRHAGLGAALAFVILSTAPASACGWWWSCSEGYGYRQPTRVYGYTARQNLPTRIPSRAELRG